MVRLIWIATSVVGLLIGARGATAGPMCSLHEKVLCAEAMAEMSVPLVEPGGARFRKRAQKPDWYQFPRTVWRRGLQAARVTAWFLSDGLRSFDAGALSVRVPHRDAWAAHRAGGLQLLVFLHRVEGDWSNIAGVEAHPNSMQKGYRKVRRAVRTIARWKTEDAVRGSPRTEFDDQRRVLRRSRNRQLLGLTWFYLCVAGHGSVAEEFRDEPTSRLSEALEDWQTPEHCREAAQHLVCRCY